MWVNNSGVCVGRRWTDRIDLGQKTDFYRGGAYLWFLRRDPLLGAACAPCIRLPTLPVTARLAPICAPCAHMRNAAQSLLCRPQRGPQPASTRRVVVLQPPPPPRALRLSPPAVPRGTDPEAPAWRQRSPVLQQPFKSAESAAQHLTFRYRPRCYHPDACAGERLPGLSCHACLNVGTGAQLVCRGGLRSSAPSRLAQSVQHVLVVFPTYIRRSIADERVEHGGSRSHEIF